eukprot:6955572-Prymnesium_polylepis.1
MCGSIGRAAAAAAPHPCPAPHPPPHRPPPPVHCFPGRAAAAAAPHPCPRLTHRRTARLPQCIVGWSGRAPAAD